MLGLVITCLGTQLVTTGHPADMAILMVTVSGGPKALTGVNCIVWSEYDHSIDMIFWFCMCSLLISGSDNFVNQDYHCMREKNSFR